MKLVTFAVEDQEFIGYLKDETVYQIDSIEAKKIIDMNHLIDMFGVKGLPEESITSGISYDLSEVKILAPIRFPKRNIFCMGKNYSDHAKEVAFTAVDKKEELPKFPIYFSKVAYPALENQGTIHYREDLTKMLDYEVELGIIIGKEGKDIKEDEAMDYIFGYVNSNDISARNLQGKHGQWFKGKSVDDYCPMGPYILTSDEMEDPFNLSLKCYVNDELRQDSNTNNMIFNLKEIIADLSRGLTLRPGDIILTGTPAGVGLGFKPYKFLNPGDVVRCEIEKLGTLITYIK